MSETFNPHSHFAHLKLPAQDLTKLSFCDSAKPAHLRAWVNKLQTTRIRHTSVLLYQALPEITRLRTDAKTRVQMLEVMRPVVQNITIGLATQFLGKSLILPPEAHKAAVVAQALQKSMADGYSLCARDLLDRKSLGSTDRGTLAKALYAAISSMGALHLRSCQIYTHLASGLWFHTHQLFRTAEHLQLGNYQVEDPLLHSRTSANIRDCYLRVIMLACSRPNQFNQQDLQLAYDAFESWATRVSLSEEVVPDNANPLIINLSRDEPPTYKERFDGEEDDYLLEIDFSSLLPVLKDKEETSPLDGVDNLPPHRMPKEVIQHLLAAWTKAADRQQYRHKVNTIVDVCVGLTECHYHISGGQSFSANERSGDPRSDDSHLELFHSGTLGGFTPGDTVATPQGGTEFTTSRAKLQNISAGGYCLHWQNAAPAHATTGQLLGIREAGQRNWHLAVVRWVRQLRGAAQTGVQILALDAEPAAASMIYDMGGCSEPMRALMVQSGFQSETAPTLITAAAPFQEFTQIRLETREDTRLLTLNQSVFATNRIRQFRYQQGSKTGESAVNKTKAGKYFDSRWD